jgi:TolA-binding protein
MKSFLYLILFSLMLAFVGCSKKSSSDYMKKAKADIDHKNVDDAVTAYQNIINDYPSSPEAPEALFELATLYQGNMVKNYSEQDSFQKAVTLFRQVYDKYPDAKLAPKSLFMSGFIEANNLKEYNKATEVFNLFLQKFPNNELASSAKEELDNMGLSPEEILAKKQMSKN